MKPEHVNFSRPLIYPADHSSQNESVSSKKFTKYLPEGQTHSPKRNIDTYIIVQTSCQEKLQVAEHSENSTGDNHNPIRKSERKRTKKLPFDEIYLTPKKKRSKKEKSNNTAKHEAFYTKYDYLPDGEKRSLALDSWMETEEQSESPEWNVWPKNITRQTAFPTKNYWRFKEHKVQNAYGKHGLPVIPVEDAQLPFEKARLPYQPLDFLALSEQSAHDESLFDITDFVSVYRTAHSLQKNHRSRKSTSQESVKPLINTQELLKEKNALLQEITTCVRPLREETIKWDAYHDAREFLKPCSDQEIQFKTSPKPEELMENYQRKKADLAKAQKEYEHIKVKLEDLTSKLKLLQKKEAYLLTRQNKPGLELLSISELIRRMRSFTCFFLNSESHSSLLSILAIEPYRREKSQALAEAKPLIAELEDKRGTWCKRTQRTKLTQFRDSLMLLKPMLMKIEEHQHQLEESEAIDSVLESLNLFSKKLKTKQHDETYQCLKQDLHNLEWDIVRC